HTSPRHSLMVASVWTAGCLVYLVHFATAMSLVHHWSHAAAWQHTAEQTQRVIGWTTGVGIWFNDLFTILWPVHVVDAWRCVGCGRTILSSRVRNAIDIYLTFIILNATLVFGPPWWWAVFASAATMAFVLRTVSRPGRNGRDRVLSTAEFP
ncbi:MAG: hypothetical protein KDA75_10645, partial [Planctomycetaceae bacterium]|nr:hypothetical protein [Planctomycetaceae bacterium]